MRKILVLAIAVLVSLACSDLNDLNDELCVSPFCGETISNQVNITVYNDTDIDLNDLVWSIGAYQDTISFLPSKQFSCWVNIDRVSTDYIYLEGLSNELVYQQDTLHFDTADVEVLQSGNWVLEIDGDQSNQSLAATIDPWDGDCRSF